MIRARLDLVLGAGVVTWIDVAAGQPNDERRTSPDPTLETAVILSAARLPPASSSVRSKASRRRSWGDRHPRGRHRAGIDPRSRRRVRDGQRGVGRLGQAPPGRRRSAPGCPTTCRRSPSTRCADPG
jgi:hypothetical protein